MSASTASAGASTYGTLRRMCPTMSSEPRSRPALLVGADPGPTGLGGAPQGGRRDLRDRWDGFAAVGVADRVARVDPLRTAAVAAALGSRWLWLVAAQALAGGQVRAAAAFECRISRTDPWCNRFQPPRNSDGGVAA